MIVTVLESGQGPAVTYFTVYVFAPHNDKSICPVTALIERPIGVALNVPPGVPVMDGEGSVPVWQYVA